MRVYLKNKSTSVSLRRESFAPVVLASRLTRDHSFIVRLSESSPQREVVDRTFSTPQFFGHRVGFLAALVLLVSFIFHPFIVLATEVQEVAEVSTVDERVTLSVDSSEQNYPGSGGDDIATETRDDGLENEPFVDDGDIPIETTEETFEIRTDEHEQTTEIEFPALVSVEGEVGVGLPSVDATILSHTNLDEPPINSDEIASSSSENTKTNEREDDFEEKGGGIEDLSTTTVNISHGENDSKKDFVASSTPQNIAVKKDFVASSSTPTDKLPISPISPSGAQSTSSDFQISENMPESDSATRVRTIEEPLPEGGSEVDNIPHISTIAENEIRDSVRREFELQYKVRLKNELEQIEQERKLNLQEQKQFSNDECVLLSEGELYCAKKFFGKADTQTNSYSHVYSKNVDESDEEIYIQEGNRVRQLTDNNTDDIFPSADENYEYIVWQTLLDGRWQIFLHERKRNISTQITNNSSNNIRPYVSAHGIVWQGWIDNTWDIFIAENTMGGWRTKRLTSSPWHDVNPRISGTFVLWESFESGTWQVVAHDLTTNESVTVSEGAGINKNPRLAILWEHEENGEVNIYEYSLQTKSRKLVSEAPHVPIKQAPILPLEFPESVPEQGGALPGNTTNSSTTPQIKEDGDEGNSAP